MTECPERDTRSRTSQRGHPLIHKEYVLTTEIAQVVEEWKNKEDAHGGSGYYEGSRVIARQVKSLTIEQLRKELRDLHG